MGFAQDGCQSLTSSIFASFHFSTLMGLSCLFFTFPCSWLALHVSWAFPAICGLLFIPTIIYFLLTSFTDTGILHKGIEEELVNQAFTMKDLNQHWCNKCQLYCLQHTFHCSWCNTCVEEFDHHCMWVNNCIGYHNLRFFIFFVAFLSGYDLAVLASCLVYLAFNSQQAFSVEKICTVLVTIPTAFYMVPLLLLVCTQIRYILTAHHSCKFQALSFKQPLALNWQDSGWCKRHRTKYRVRSSGVMALGAAEAAELCHVPWVSSMGSAIPGSCPHSCSQDLSRQQKVLKAWRHFLSAMGSLLHREGPRLGGASAEKTEKQVGKKKSSWQMNSQERMVEIPIPDMLDSVELLDPDQDLHWKCQIHGSRRPASSPTATLLSVSDI
ncbi:palmitoyltransferase ZDHHC19 [Podarcis raffonei]|uniref:palmitoyltransferase ZDHHC19 n=1 Tax=Podarcis raffonei TaxID=65483 RepID=UPI0023293EE9|nr:palmitoyltransferase ZDHHC19 [Podarcis raffonei]